MRSPSVRLLAPALLSLTLLGAGLSSATAGTPPETTIEPATLERGTNPGVPIVLGTKVLHRDRRIAVPGREVQLLGRSGTDYVALVYGDNGRPRVQRVAPDGSRETVMRGFDGEVAMSRDGEQLFETRYDSATSATLIVVRDAVTGEREDGRVFRGFVRVLDADERRAVLGGSSPSRTLWWHTRTDETLRISGREGYFADIAADRFATMKGEGENLCSVLSTLPPNAEVLWRSCRRGVLAASPNGRRVVTTHIYRDGPTSTLQVNGHHGRLLASYDTPGSFGRVVWESRRAVLIEAFGTERTAIVRCELGDCERASRRIAAQ